MLRPATKFVRINLLPRFKQKGPAMNPLEQTIKEVRDLAERLEANCPACEAETPREDAAHVLIHALYDAAREAESALNA